MRRLRRTMAIVIWTIGVFVGWMWSVSVGARLLVNVANRHRWPAPPDWIERLIAGGGIGLTLLFVVWTALLGLRGRLPGTRKGHAGPPQGFPMDSLPPGD